MPEIGPIVAKMYSIWWYSAVRPIYWHNFVLGWSGEANILLVHSVVIKAMVRFLTRPGREIQCLQYEAVVITSPWLWNSTV
mgnify:CR=1 FL=1